MKAPEWSIKLITRTGEGIVPRILEGTYDWDIQRKVLSGGSFTTFTNPGNTVGMTLIPRTAFEGKTYEYGKFVVTSCKPEFNGPRTSWTIDFMDEAVILSRMRLLEPYTLSRTSRASFAVNALLARNNVEASISPSDRTLRVAMAWNPDDNVLDTITSLLAVCGFHPLWPSPRGLYSGPHVNLEKAKVAHKFVEGEESLHLPNYPQEEDYLAVPNRLLGTTNGDNTSEPLRAVARDVSTSPWSYEARGYWVDADPYDSEIGSQAGLVLETERKLKELQYNAVTMSIEHLWTPDITPGCIVTVEADNPNVAGRWQATKSGTSMLGADALVTTDLRKVR